MKKIVISGINLYEGGPLSVYHDCLDALINKMDFDEIELTIFVHSKELFRKYEKKAKIISLPLSRKNYLFRLWYEYAYFWWFSRNKNIDVWFSLHDISPNVHAKEKYVYCHNPSPFYKYQLREIKYGFTNFLFSLFYRYLYQINIRKNTNVFVQQHWIKKEFEKMYNISNLVVSSPDILISPSMLCNVKRDDNEKFTFIYPAFPRNFKNFEMICEAAELLDEKGVKNFEVLMTIDGTENSYSQAIVNKYNSLTYLKFIGLQNRDTVYQLYSTVDALVFPSKLETWGLPISEFKLTEKPILLIDLPYAHETLGEYKSACFFQKDCISELVSLMEQTINKTIIFDRIVIDNDTAKLASWQETWEFILQQRYGD